jgi:LPXTG-site transpeptidase (sortase) family protein
MIRKEIQNSLINTVFFLWVGVVGYSFFSVLPSSLQTAPSSSIADSSLGWRYPNVRFPETGNGQLANPDSSYRGGEAQGLPVRLRIPIINVDSAIEDAYVTSDGRIDSRPGSANVSWFSLGPLPGEIGSAVIGGNYGEINGEPFVFDNLSQLKIGDNVYIENDKGETLAFLVKSTRYFERNDDVSSVFMSEDGRAHLNLITYEGVWNQENESSPDRLVVFTDAIPLDGSDLISPRFPETGGTMSTVSNRLFSASIFKDIVTPMDQLITSFLLILIVLVIFEIVRPLVDLVLKSRVKRPQDI